MQQDKMNLQVRDEQDNNISNDTNCCPKYNTYNTQT